MTSHLEEKYQTSWQERQTFAENMQPLIGQLFRNKGIEITIYGRPLVNASAIDIIKAHKSVALHEESKLRLRESFPFVEALSKMNISPARIDVGKLAYRYLFQGGANGLSIEQYLEKELADIIKKDENEISEVYAQIESDLSDAMKVLPKKIKKKGPKKVPPKEQMEEDSNTITYEQFLKEANLRDFTKKK